MRKYQPIWEALKKYKKAMLSAHPHSHARIIKAVTKEKWMDSGFRLLMSEQGKSFMTRHEVSNKEQILTFYLEEIVEDSNAVSIDDL